MGMLGTTAREVAHSLAFLQAQLSDAEFRKHAIAQSDGMYNGIRALVNDAVKAGEIRNVDSARLARAVQATLHGSALEWTIRGKGPLPSWVRRDLQTVLRPYFTQATRHHGSPLVPNP